MQNEFNSFGQKVTLYPKSRYRYVVAVETAGEYTEPVKHVVTEGQMSRVHAATVLLSIGREVNRYMVWGCVKRFTSIA